MGSLEQTTKFRKSWVQHLRLLVCFDLLHDLIRGTRRTNQNRSHGWEDGWELVSFVLCNFAICEASGEQGSTRFWNISSTGRPLLQVGAFPLRPTSATLTCWRWLDQQGFMSCYDQEKDQLTSHVAAVHSQTRLVISCGTYISTIIHSSSDSAVCLIPPCRRGPASLQLITMETPLIPAQEKKKKKSQIWLPLSSTHAERRTCSHMDARRHACTCRHAHAPLEMLMQATRWCLLVGEISAQASSSQCVTMRMKLLAVASASCD